MIRSHELDCPAARLALSARLDGELVEQTALLRHLSQCADCREHERSLAEISRAWSSLRDVQPTSELWSRIEARARAGRRPRPRLSSPLLARLAAGLIGFVSLGGATWWLEGSAEPAGSGRHLLERIAPSGPDPGALFAALPEYQLLRRSPSEDAR